MKRPTIRIALILVSVLLFMGCSVIKPKSGDKPPKELKSFLADFEKAVVSHNTEKLMELMDPDYVKNQHDEMLRGNTSQFINEFFCGNLADGSGFKCLKLLEIEGAKMHELVKEDGYYYVYYTISSAKIKVTCSWTITVKEIDGERIFGFFGASG